MSQLMIIIILMGIICADTIKANSSDEDDKKCIKSANTTKAQTQSILKHKIFENKDTTVANTPKQIQCYCTCFFEKYGIFLNGKPNEAFLRHNLPLLINDKKKADAAIDKCTILTGEDKCAIGFNFALCLVKETDLDIY